MSKTILAILLTAVCSFKGLSQDGEEYFETSPNGLEYRFLKKGTGNVAAVGDSISFNLTSRIGDSSLYNSRRSNKGKPVQYLVMPIAIRGDLAEGFAMMAKGDVAEFQISVDTLLNQGQELPKWVQRNMGLKLKYNIELLSIKSIAQEDEKQLQALFKTKGIKPTKTKTGLYYTTSKKGTGAAPQSGDTVVVNYTGRLLDGDAFDSNTDAAFGHLQPYSFVLGSKKVIAGWEEGIALLPKGTKAVFYIPSSLAYGSASPGQDIPANSVLVFDMELLEVKKKMK